MIDDFLMLVKSCSEWTHKQWISLKKNANRTIPEKYFNGYRRLADTKNEMQEGECWCCKHAVAYKTWWCELSTRCEWTPCYVKSDLGWADLNAGGSRWLGIPDSKKKQIIVD